MNADTTPPLVNWALRLTPEGEALAAYVEAEEVAVPDVVVQTRSKAPSLIKPVARWFADDPASAAELWARYQASIRVEEA